MWPSQGDPSGFTFISTSSESLQGASVFVLHFCLMQRLGHLSRNQKGEGSNPKRQWAFMCGPSCIFSRILQHRHISILFLVLVSKMHTKHLERAVMCFFEQSLTLPPEPNSPSASCGQLSVLTFSNVIQ